MLRSLSSSPIFARGTHHVGCFARPAPVPAGNSLSALIELPIQTNLWCRFGYQPVTGELPNPLCSENRAANHIIKMNIG
jgi:hypothetical protein